MRHNKMAININMPNGDQVVSNLVSSNDDHFLGLIEFGCNKINIVMSNIPNGYELDGTPKSLSYEPSKKKSSTPSSDSTSKLSGPRVDYDKDGDLIDWDRYAE